MGSRTEAATMLTLLTLLVCLQLQPPVLSVSCDCELIRVSASGGAAEHQHRFLGDYRPAGSLWEDSVNVTYYKSDSERFISPSVFSNPSSGQITWVLTDMLLGLNAGIMNQKYTDFLCPQLIPDSWLYLWNNQWLKDQSLTISCF